MKMVLFEFRYTLDKDKLAEYAKFAKEEAMPFWLSVPGLKEFRGYREQGSYRILVEMEFDSFESWGKAYDNPKTKEMNSKFALYIHDLEWKLWDVSPLIPQPLKPKR